MPRKKPMWSQDSLQKAIEAVKNGMGKRKAAETYGIPWGTFTDKLSGRRKLDGSAAQTVLTTEEELEVFNFLKSSAERGFGKSKDELLVTVQTMLNFRGRTTKWKDNLPQEKWFRLFKKRFPDLVFRKPQKLGKQRALVTKSKLLTWFDEFSSCIKNIDPTILLEPHRIYNCDESGFSLDASSGKILAFLGTKFVYQVACEQRLMITVLACCSASGHYVWPMIIYPGKQFRGFQPNDIFQEAFITKSDNGWTNQTIFINWLEKVFIPQTADVKKPVLLLVDGHVSHMSIRAAQLCLENNIILYALPAHASHIMQPLDVGVFRTMKREWRKALKQHNEVEVITKRSFAKVFKSAYENTTSRDLAAQAFRKSGLFPFDPSSIQWEKVLPTSKDPDVNDSIHQDVDLVATISSSASLGNVLPTVTRSAPHTTTTSALHAATISALPAAIPACATSALPTSSTSTLPAGATSAISAGASSALPAGATSALPATITSTLLAATTPGLPAASSSNPDLPVAGTSSNPDGSKDRALTLRKFAMISAQVGESMLNKYFERHDEGYDCADPMYELWKSYHDDILSTKSPSPPPVLKDPLTVPCIQKGPPMKKRKVQQQPSLISGQEFVNLLIEKQMLQKEEEERKSKRKAEIEKRKIEKIKLDEEKKRNKEEREKKRGELKKQKEEEMKKRKEERLKKQEERMIIMEMKKKANKGKGKKRKNRIASDTSSSMDESEMVLDDRSDEDVEVDVIEDLLMDDTFEVETELRAYEDDGEQEVEGSTNENGNVLMEEGSLNENENVVVEGSLNANENVLVEGSTNVNGNVLIEGSLNENENVLVEGSTNVNGNVLMEEGSLNEKGSGVLIEKGDVEFVEKRKDVNKQYEVNRSLWNIDIFKLK